MRQERLADSCPRKQGSGKKEHSKHPLNIYMFPSPRTGGMYHPDSIVKLHEKILNDAGIEHLRFHDLRHSFATYALQSGADVKTLSCMLGHYSAGFTLNTYCHATRDMQADAARKRSADSCQHKLESDKKNPLKRRKHRAKTVRCFPLLSAFGSRFGSETFSRLLRAREVKLNAVTF